MSKPKILITIGAAAFAFVMLCTFAKYAINTLVNPYPNGSECFSPQQARQDGVLIHTLTASPKSLRVNGEIVSIEDAWIESKSVVKFHLAWFRYRQPTGGYTLCIRFAQGDDLLQGFVPYFLLNSESGDPFRIHGRGHDEIVFCADVDEVPASISVTIAQSRKDRSADKPSFTLSLHPPDTASNGG